METRPPHRTDFEAPQVGHTAHYALRWISKNGQPGLWSPVSGHMVT